MIFPALRRYVLPVVFAISVAHTAVADEKPIVARPGLFDLSNSETLGLTTVPGRRVLLYRAEKGDHQFCHHPSLVRFKGQFYCIWSNGVIGEDEPGQRILLASSLDGLAWSRSVSVAIDPLRRAAT